MPYAYAMYIYWVYVLQWNYIRPATYSYIMVKQLHKANAGKTDSIMKIRGDNVMSEMSHFSTYYGINKAQNKIKRKQDQAKLTLKLKIHQ